MGWLAFDDANLYLNMMIPFFSSACCLEADLSASAEPLYAMLCLPTTSKSLDHDAISWTKFTSKTPVGRVSLDPVILHNNTNLKLMESNLSQTGSG